MTYYFVCVFDEWMILSRMGEGLATTHNTVFKNVTLMHRHTLVAGNFYLIFFSIIRVCVIPSTFLCDDYTWL